MIDLRQAAQQAIEALDSDNPDIQLRAAVTLRAAMELPVQEPVALHEAWSLREVYFDEDGEPSMHRSPPQRPWQGLTEDEKFEMAAAQYGWEDLLIAAEARLKEKNNV